MLNVAIIRYEYGISYLYKNCCIIILFALKYFKSRALFSVALIQCLICNQMFDLQRTNHLLISEIICKIKN